MELGKLSVPGRQTNLNNCMAKGLFALSAGASGDIWTFFSLVHLLSFLSPFLGDGPIYAEILSQRAVKLKTTNRPTPLIWKDKGLIRLAVGGGCLDITIHSPFLLQTT